MIKSKFIKHLNFVRKFRNEHLNNDKAGSNTIEA